MVSWLIIIQYMHMQGPRPDWDKFDFGLIMRTTAVSALLTSAPLRVAVVGAGAIGSEFARNHFGRQTGTVVVSVVDCDSAAAAELASGISSQVRRSDVEPVRTFTDLSRALETCDTNIVYVGTPPSTHCALVKMALAAGKHVLLEKPLAASASAS